MEPTSHHLFLAFAGMFNVLNYFACLCIPTAAAVFSDLLTCMKRGHAVILDEAVCRSIGQSLMMRALS